MKTIIIEAVSNGWIVRPFEPCENWISISRPNIAVFTKIEDLAAALPELLCDLCNPMPKESSCQTFGMGIGKTP